MAFDLSTLGGLAQQVSGLFNASQNASNVNGIANDQQNGLSGQYQNLYNQINQAQNTYNTNRATTDGLNAQLQTNATNWGNQLNQLTDPNSAYMQQARQAIERKDAAAGRNSQWGDREVQLAGTLADQYSRNAPGLQGQITGALNGIGTNNKNLEDQYQTGVYNYNNAYNNLLGQANTAAQTAAVTQQAANNQQSNAVGNAVKAGAGAIKAGLGSSSFDLSSLFGGGDTGISAVAPTFGSAGSQDSAANFFGGYNDLFGGYTGGETQFNYGAGGAGITDIMGGGASSNPFGSSFSSSDFGSMFGGGSSLGGLW